MPNDAKLGLVVGVGLVIAVAVVFFRKEVGDVGTSATKSPQTDTPSPAGTPGKRPPSVELPSGGGAATARRHTVREGETLSVLARRYYGDESKSALIFQVNRRLLTSPDDLPPGTTLEIPAAGDSHAETP